MQEPKHDKERGNFQLERFTFFSDGVFAISITLLVIELKVPNIEHSTDALLWKSLTEMALKVLGFIISFGIVGHYWSVHHRIFGYVIKYTTSLLWINLGFLFTVVLLPFSAALFGEYSSDTNMKIPYAMYVFNMCLTGFMNYWLWMYVSSPKRGMLTRKISKARIRLGGYRSLVIPLIFIVSLGIFFISPRIAYSILLLIPIILHWGMGSLEKRAEKDETPAVASIPKNATLIIEEVKEADKKSS